LLINLKMIL